MLRLTSYDVFRRLPRDLTHGTSHGGVLSVLAVLLIGLVIFLEFWTYLTGEVETAVMLDTNREQLLQINFRIQVPQLPCEFASIDVWDYMGNNKLDISENIHKTITVGPNGEQIVGVWEDGMARGTGYTQDEVKAKIGIQESTKLNQADFSSSLAANNWSFVDFYAPWCIHCVRLSPTWEAFAKTVHERDIHVKVYTVDCTENAFLCRSEGIYGYPTLRVYKGTTAMFPDYMGKRTVHTLLDWMESMTKEHAHKHVRKHVEEGCIMTGTVWVNRIPGVLHVTAKSGQHDFDPKTTNMSHVVHHFSFGTALPGRVLRRLPPEILRSISPLDGRTFSSSAEHQTHEHYIKVVSTHYRVGKSSLFGRSDPMGYQMATSNHQFTSDPAVPEIKFSFDLSPTAVVIVQGGKRWYEFVTSLCAIVGGVFTVVSLLDGAVYSISKQVKGAQGKLS